MMDYMEDECFALITEPDEWCHDGFSSIDKCRKYAKERGFTTYRIERETYRNERLYSREVVEEAKP